MRWCDRVDPFTHNSCKSGHPEVSTFFGDITFLLEKWPRTSCVSYLVWVSLYLLWGPSPSASLTEYHTNLRSLMYEPVSPISFHKLSSVPITLSNTNPYPLELTVQDLPCVWWMTRHVSVSSHHRITTPTLCSHITFSENSDVEIPVVRSSFNSAWTLYHCVSNTLLSSDLC